MSNDHTASPARLRTGVAVVLVVAALDVMSMGLVMPVMPALILDLTGSALGASWWTGVSVAVWSGAQLLFSPLIGSLSDRFGRRPVILVSTAGVAADWVLLALAPDLVWLVVARILGGLTSSSFTACFAFVADVVPPEKRARAYGWIGAAFSAGFVLGPALGGLLGGTDPRLPFWVAAAVSAATFLFGLLALPETLPPERRMPFSAGRANPFGAMRLLVSRAGLARLAGVYGLEIFVHHVFTAVFVLYAGRRFGWGAFEVGLILALVGALDVVVQSLLVGRIVARLGDRPTMLIGLASGAAGVAAIGLATAPGWLVAAIVINAGWGLAMPTSQALMTRRVTEREQGQLQGATSSVASLAGIVGPLAFGLLYGATADAAPGLAFLAAGAILALAVAVAWRSEPGDAPERSGQVATARGLRRRDDPHPSGTPS